MYTITRQIGCDIGHRVPTHGSKCKNVHGHRYTIEATCLSKQVHREGEQKDMILDFGFLKEEMMNVIDKACDHGFICWRDDPLLPLFLANDNEDLHGENLRRIDKKIQEFGECVIEPPKTTIGKLNIVPFIPTAEKLAEHWYKKLYKRVFVRSEEQAVLSKIKVWETPNCTAEYIGGVEEWLKRS